VRRVERARQLGDQPDRALGFERFHNAHHRYHATGRRTPDEISRSHRRAPLAAAQIPAGWPGHGRIEFIRFIRSDHKLRLLGRAIPMPDGAAYQYVTAALDLALPDERNLLISDSDGELITVAGSPNRAADPPESDRAAGSPLHLALRARLPRRTRERRPSDR